MPISAAFSTCALLPPSTAHRPAAAMEQATPTSPWQPTSAPEMEEFSLNRPPSAAATARKRALADPLAVLDWVNLWALAVNEENAAGGRVVTAPTNGAAGIIPAVLRYHQRFVAHADADGTARFLAVAAAIGGLFKENASISGAEVGCQARLALLGDGTHRVSLDQVIETMRRTGADMNERYKETALGGLAVNVVEC